MLGGEMTAKTASKSVAKSSYFSTPEGRVLSLLSH